MRTNGHSSSHRSIQDIADKGNTPTTASDEVAPGHRQVLRSELHDWAQSGKEQSRTHPGLCQRRVGSSTGEGDIWQPIKPRFARFKNACSFSSRRPSRPPPPSSSYKRRLTSLAYPRGDPVVATSATLTLQQISRHLQPSFTAMLSVASLLNPAPSGVPCHRLPPSPAASSPTDSFADETAFYGPTAMPKHRKPKDAAVFTKGRAKGLVGFPPHERLDEASVREVRKYHVFPFGKIQDYCRHIPYNSGKKDFFEKTGRESFEGKAPAPFSGRVCRPAGC